MKAILSSAILLALCACLSANYEHDKWGTSANDEIFVRQAFISCFDTGDDNNGDGIGEAWGVPEWVAFEIKGNQPRNSLPNSPGWSTDKTLHANGEAPNNETYRIPAKEQLDVVDGSYRFARGHMCPRATALRISPDAAKETYTFLNAVPQLQWQNNGIWGALEDDCLEWADKFKRIWVICGPVFHGKNPSLWLGQEGEVKAAIPDALFKIVIREDGIDSLETIAFIIPNIIPESHSNYWAYLTTIDEIEDLTGIDFLMNLSSSEQKRIQKETGKEW